MDASNAEKQQKLEHSAHIDTRWAFKGAGLTLRQDILQFPDGRMKEWNIIERPDAVVIIPLLSDDEVILIKQFRRAAGEILFELPAGLLEEGEHPESCAAREIREETGYAAMEMIPFGQMISAPGFCSERLHFFLGKHLEPAPLPPDLDEAIDLFPIHLSEALSMIDDGRIIDAKTIAGLLRYVRLLNS